MGEVYVLLPPEHVEANDAKNYHILDAERDDVSGAFSYPHGTRTLCNGYEKKDGARINNDRRFAHNDNLMRTKLAELQNSDTQICANCVKHFYADDDSKD